MVNALVLHTRFMNKSKKEIQLGMNPSTASGKLVKDILFSFIQKDGILCHRCNKEMERDNFSIEHKTPWLDSEDPVKLYFDLDNISFSHLKCNIQAHRTIKNHPSVNAYNRGCKCDECKNLKKLKMQKYRKNKNALLV